MTRRTMRFKIEVIGLFLHIFRGLAAAHIACFRRTSITITRYNFLHFHVKFLLVNCLER